MCLFPQRKGEGIPVALSFHLGEICGAYKGECYCCSLLFLLPSKLGAGGGNGTQNSKKKSDSTIWKQPRKIDTTIFPVRRRSFPRSPLCLQAGWNAVLPTDLEKPVLFLAADRQVKGCSRGLSTTAEDAPFFVTSSTSCSTLEPEKGCMAGEYPPPLHASCCCAAFH